MQLIKFLKGENKDLSLTDQPDGTFRDGVHINLYVQKGAIVNEFGNKLVGSSQYTITKLFGSHTLPDERICILGEDSYGGGSQFIAVGDVKTNSFKTIYRNNDLNFQESNPVDIKSKKTNAGDIIIYFTDNYYSTAIDNATGIEYLVESNPPRTFNISKQERFLPNVNTPIDQAILYGVTEYNIQKLDLFLPPGNVSTFSSGITQVPDVEIIEGGSVSAGSYNLCLAYMDEDFNVTNVFATSQTIHVTAAPEDVIPTDNFIGAKPGTQTDKSIKFWVTFPDQLNYKYVKPFIIQRYEGLNNTASELFIYELQEEEIPVANPFFRRMPIVYSGGETAAQGSLGDVLGDRIRYEVAKTLTPLDNNLYLANLKTRPELGYQRWANSITVDCVTEKVNHFDPKYFSKSVINRSTSQLVNPYGGDNYFTSINNLGSVYDNLQSNEGYGASQRKYFSRNTRKGFKDAVMHYKYKCFRRQEVYALYISFVLNDGSETQAYHIPGRAHRNLPTNGVENATITSSTLSTTDIPNLFALRESLPDLRVHQMIDTQALLWESGDQVTTGFWSNMNEFYPNTSDWEIWTTNSNGESQFTGSTLKGLQVRHHKMASNKIERFSFIADSDTSSTPNWASQFSPSLDSDDNFDSSSTGYFTTEEDINLLGIKLNNIHIPTFILNQIQGYKIYYAERTPNNRTILGQSVPTPADFVGVSSIGTPLNDDVSGPYERSWNFTGSLTRNPSETLKSTTNELRYHAIGFHDMGLMKQKYTVNGASFLDVQYIIPFRQYRGGPGQLPTTTNGDKFFNSLGWISSDLGNTHSLSNSGTSLRVRSWVTSTMIAAGYMAPTRLNDAELVQMNRTGSYRLSNTSSTYLLDADSSFYMDGNSVLQNLPGSSFSGADNLYNFAGESKLALGLLEGLPVISHWGSTSNYPQSTVESQNRFPWYHPLGYVNETIDAQSYNHEYYMQPNRPNIALWADSLIGGHPVSYLANLCAVKSDVFESFDEQPLVWTGYYKSLKRVNAETGQDSVSGQNYYTGAQSDNIFGGDTYITRNSFRITSMNYGLAQWKGFTDINGTKVSDIPLDYVLEGTGNNSLRSALLNQTLWTYGGESTPMATLFYHLTESDHMCDMRYVDREKIKETQVFPYNSANDVLFADPLKDQTKSDNILYPTNYSLNQNLKVTTPRSKFSTDSDTFLNRTIRSIKDSGERIDGYRYFLGLDYKETPGEKGQINELFTKNGLLFIHAERGLFGTKGKETLNTGGDSTAYVGSGDIFAQDPDEILTTDNGYAGTDCQFSGVDTKFGRFFVNRKDRKIYLFGEGIEEISQNGMEGWFTTHIPYVLENFGVNVELVTNADAVTENFGFVAAYDPIYKHIILTKRELLPTATFITEWNSGNIEVDLESNTQQFLLNGAPLALSNTTYFQAGGWTRHYYPEIKQWGGRSKYLPKLASSTQEYYCSLVTGSSSPLWVHNDKANPGNFYGTLYDSEFEFVVNPRQFSTFKSIFYQADVVTPSNINLNEFNKHVSPGFTSYLVYNTKQISGDYTDINYLTNARLVRDMWHLNSFRDLSLTNVQTASDLVTGLPNVQDDFTTGVIASTNTQTMFISDGIVNLNYIDTNKQWYDQKRFKDTFLAVRLKCDNIAKNLVYLYAAGAKFIPISR